MKPLLHALRMLRVLVLGLLLGVALYIGYLALGMLP